ncbi:hypothetical protein UFOVP686_17 [uncultured Caudovirales phage]|uniref:Uncharacterized protein n=1 Tax=uncultured Caudovirales phage TaxID=2100421 RepID=A0A6J7X693_9CAUD|nr:hypothetical protein UFOVP686_17 [uncultured Caudovirales phage]CAB5225336.1 hypothetical protein UFOVP752_3 [uncultured Caudovirales phage]
MRDVLDLFANAESGGNINARSSTPLSDAQGLFGFTSAAFNQVLQDHPDLRHVTKEQWAVDPQLQRTFADRLKQRHESILAGQGIDVNPVSLYANWHFGEGGGPKFLKSAPDTRMEDILDPIAIEANPYLKGKTQAEVMQIFGKKMGVALPNAVSAVSSSQGNTAMNPNQAPQSVLTNARAAYNPEDPVSVYNFITSNQQNVPVQQLTPEQREMLLADRQQRAGMLPMALAASLAGDKRVSAVGNAMAQDAFKARGPQRLGNAGWITEDGTVIKDPFQEEEGQQRRQDVALNLALQTSNTQALRRLATENTFTQAGRTPDGKPVVSNRTGQTYIVENGPNGPSYTPYSQNIIPNATYDKDVQAVQAALGSVRRSDAILAQVDQTPEAFGFVAQGVSKLPQFAQGRAAEILLSPEVMKTRTDVLRSAAQEISQLYGAALSLGEQARANTFIPNQDDPPQVVIQKLKAARDWAHATTQNYGPGVLRDAQGRIAMPNPQPGAQGQSAPAGGETRKTINGKNYVNRGGQWYEE